jgi:hypothetical protein
MADAGLFVGWGAPIAGRETKGLGVFGEAIAFYGSCEEAGDIESFETVLLSAHGGGLSGFFLLRGSEQQCTALRAPRWDARRAALRWLLCVRPRRARARPAARPGCRPP